MSSPDKHDHDDDQLDPVEQYWELTKSLEDLPRDWRGDGYQHNGYVEWTIRVLDGLKARIDELEREQFQALDDALRDKS